MKQWHYFFLQLSLFLTITNIVENCVEIIEKLRLKYHKIEAGLVGKTSIQISFNIQHDFTQFL